MFSMASRRFVLQQARNSAMLRRPMSQAATSGPDRKHVAVALGVTAAAMGVVAYMRMQENKNPALRRRTTHCYPGFMPGDAKK